MANLTAKTPFDGLLPIEAGDVHLTEITHDGITWIAPNKGQMAKLSRALDKQMGADFPSPNTHAKGLVWFGPDQALALGKPLKPVAGAAMVDQSSAWACCALEGADAALVLARLVPIDLRDSAFGVGSAARTLLGHMNCVLMRTGAERYEVMVFRSMAASLVHEVERAMKMVAARAELTG
ncbi:sarcosine oxidase subunit gamma [Gymnodinialimonas hymeniacidonis]|uniref:sarcosine oxidase subunit gamma n=1 Tax=Gymnodinialimonas hymeniacidonis TaxID=3126508 RepID=UPI0034C62D44